MRSRPVHFTTPQLAIHQRFEQVAAANPYAAALKFEQRVMTYDQLNRASNAMACFLLEKLGPEHGNVAILMENCPEQIIAVLAVLKAGKAYVPMDTGFPEERIRFMLQDAGCKGVIVNKAFKGIPEDMVQFHAEHELSTFPDQNPDLDVHPDFHAIILYTSGSTGEPKGVIQTHENMVHFIKRMTELTGIRPEDRFAYYLSFGFSAHALPLLGALLNGCELKIFNLKQDGLGAFARWFRHEKISTTLMIPSFLRHFLASLEKGQTFPALRLLFLGGETLYRSDVEKARKAFPRDTILVNILASTEAYLSRAFIMNSGTPIGSNIVPIGYPVEGIEMLILDDAGKPCSINQPGEIFLKSRFLTPGYWNRPAQTAKDISVGHEDEGIRILRTYDKGYFRDENCIVHTGRMDTMVKLRGYRVDLGEIDNVLLANEEVREAIATVKRNRQGVEHIIAFVAGKEDHALDPGFIRAKAAKVLPDYMVPSFVVPVSGLPKNSSGKTDRKSLPEPEWNILEGTGEKVPPSNEQEEKLVGIFEKALNIRPIGVTDNFLELGADSLRLFVAFNDVEKQFGKKLRLEELTANPTIKNLAGVLKYN